MINSHDFQQAAKKFRAGRITLKDLTDLVFAKTSPPNPNEVLHNKSTNPTSTSAAELTPLPQRHPQSHKGDFGRVLAIGGSEGMAGAISLTGLAALRSGSGLVKVAVPEMIQALVATFNPCLMTLGCASEGESFHGAAERSLAHHSEWADVIALGPGMGRGGAQQWIAQKLYAEIPQPMVVDADGLNSLADADVTLKDHEGQRILTPHPGEFQRLAKTEITNRTELESQAKSLAQETGTVIVLKGNQTYVTDGQQDYRNNTGNPGMATAGSGDVLTGVVTSFIGQGLTPFDAACLGVRVHGVAGDLAASQLGQSSLIASDLLDHLPAALKRFEQ